MLLNLDFILDLVNSQGSDRFWFFFNRLLWLHHGGSSEGKVSDYGLSRKATMAACPSKGKWVCVCECVWRK